MENIGPKILMCYCVFWLLGATRREPISSGYRQFPLNDGITTGLYSTRGVHYTGRPHPLLVN